LGRRADHRRAAPVDSVVVSAGPPTYSIRTFGCQMNEHDSERMAGMLEAGGYSRTEDPEDTSVLVFNTCCIRENADSRLYGNLGHAKRIKDNRPGMRIVVAGCLAQKDRHAIQKRAPWVDVVLGTHNLASLPRLLEQSQRAPAFEILEQTEVFPSALPARRSSPWHAWVSISIGCNNACTFCIVPAVRGKEVSRRGHEIVEEVESLVADGVVEITLLGQNVNSYGRDLGGTPLFAELLRALDKVDGLERIRFTSPHPKDFRVDTVAAMAECDSVCEHIHLPLQAGSDRVLKVMKRAYTRARYLDKVRMVREAIPGVAITTDIIVGFPGETEDDFGATLEVVEEVRYDAAYTFQYSPRPGTVASDLPGHLPKDVVQRRYDRLTESGAGARLLSFANGSTRLGDQLRSNNVWFDSPQVRSASGGNRARLYAPATFQPGSSYSHLNDATYRRRNPNSLMTPFLGGGEAIHNPGPITRAVFSSIGW